MYQYIKQIRAVPLLVICSLLFAITALLYVGFKANPSGDEPHFLIISQTLLKYHSLDVMLDYSNRDYLQFYPVRIDPHVTFNAQGEILPLHSIGGPILWLLPFAVLGRIGAVLFISLLSVLTIWNMYRLLLIMGLSKRTSFIVSLVYAVASPLYTYAHLTFIEPIGMLVCTYVVRKIFEEELSLPSLLLSSILLGILPWVHMRFALIEMPLFFALLYKIYFIYKLDRPRYYAYYLLPVTLLFLLFEIYSYTIWGTLNPAANQINGGSTPFEVSPWMGIWGIWIDQEHGLFVNFPIFVFLLPGIVMAAKKKYAAYHLLVLALSIPYIVAFTSFRHWSGGWCPPARFMLVLLPLYSLYIACALEQIPTWLSRILFTMAVAYGCFYNILSLLPPHNGFTAENGYNRTLHLLPVQVSGRPLTAYLPSVYTGQMQVLIIWSCVFLVVAILLIASKHVKRKRLVRHTP
jgi:hypothetical protein